jgi:hypothetical protein
VTKLWSVTVEYDLLVVADSQFEAEIEAESASRDEAEPTLTHAQPFEKRQVAPDRPASYLYPPGWDDQCIPFGDVEVQKTVGQWIALLEEEARVAAEKAEFEKNQLKLFEEKKDG